MKRRLSIVAPVYNEELCLREFYQRLTAVLAKLPLDREILFVNDGSSDGSLAILKELRRADSCVKVLDLSRNFGHQIAIKAGIDHAFGDAVVVMDADLQDPPEVIPEFLKKWDEGYDVVYAVRARRAGESLFKKWTAALYYRIIKKISHIDIPLDAGDFRLIGRPAADALRSIREKSPYLRGLASWIGFRQTGISIRRDERYAGETKYSLKKMLKLAWNGITHFSHLPLQLSTYIGVAVSILCALWILQALYVSLVLKIAVPGWTSLMVAVLFLGGVQLITLGILGSYVWKNYDETRARPLYVLREKDGL